MSVKLIEINIFDVNGVWGIIVFLEMKMVYVFFYFDEIIIENIVVVIVDMKFSILVN